MERTSRVFNMVERWGVVSLLALFVLFMCRPAAAAPNENNKAFEERAEKITSTMDKMEDDQERIQALAKDFHVSASTIQDLRFKEKMGWGEIAISLAMAQQLTATSSPPLPMDQALSRVESLRDQKMGWGKIAHELGLKLGTVLSEVRRVERAIDLAERKEEKNERLSKVKVEHHEKIELRENRLQGDEKLELQNHLERPEHKQLQR